MFVILDTDETGNLVVVTDSLFCNDGDTLYFESEDAAYEYGERHLGDFHIVEIKD
jgi:hypothetical protein